MASIYRSVNSVQAAIKQTFFQIPSLYDGNLHNEEEVLAWLIEQLHTDEIEDINDEMLDKLVRETEHLAVLFCNIEMSFRKKI